MKNDRYETRRAHGQPTKGRRQKRARSLEQKLLAYSAAAGVVLAGAGAEEAQAQGTCNVILPNVTLNGTICYTDVNPDVMVMDSSSPIDFDGDGDVEFYVSEVTFINSVFLQYINVGLDTGVPTPAGGFASADRGPIANAPAALKKSDNITAGLFVASLGFLGFNTFYNFPGKGQRFIGVPIKLNGLAVNTYYGWIRVSVSANSSQVTLYDYAYETFSMTPILAGNTGAGVLPVELTTFDARADADAVLLRWATASETNNAGFELQHQRGDDWHAVAFVEGHGTSTEPQAYQHRLAGLEPGTHRFRLKQIDFDGAFDYSPVVQATVEVPGTHALSAVYPNPFNPRASFTLAVQQAQQVRVALYDALGREAAVLHDGLLSGGETHRFEIAGGDLPSGFYLVRAIGERFEATQPATLVK